MYFSVSNKQVRPWSGLLWVINQKLLAKCLPKFVQKQRQEEKEKTTKKDIEKLFASQANAKERTTRKGIGKIFELHTNTARSRWWFKGLNVVESFTNTLRPLIS